MRTTMQKPLTHLCGSAKSEVLEFLTNMGIADPESRWAGEIRNHAFITQQEREVAIRMHAAEFKTTHDEYNWQHNELIRKGLTHLVGHSAIPTNVGIKYNYKRTCQCKS